MTALLFTWIWSRIRSVLSFSSTAKNNAVSTEAAASSPPTASAPVTGSLTSQLQQLLDNYSNKTTTLIQQAIPDGVKGVPVAGGPLAPAENAIDHGYNQATSRLVHLVNNHRHRQEHAVKKHHKRLEGDVIEQEVAHAISAESREAIKKANESLPHTKLSWRQRWLLHRNQGVIGAVAHLKEKLRQHEEAKASADNHYHDLKHHRYDNKPPVKGLLDYGGLFWTLVTLLLGVEVFANFSSFQVSGIGDNNLAALSIAAFFAFLLALSAKGLGFAIRKQEKKSTYLYAALSLILCLIISSSRLTMEAGLATKALYLFVNILITIATVLVAWYYAKHHDFFKVKKQRDVLSHSIAKVNHEIHHLNHGLEREVAAIHETLEQEHHKRVTDTKHHLEEHISQQEEELDELDELLKHYQHELKEHHDGALQEYRNLNESVRQSNGHPSVTRWHQKSPRPFSGVMAILFLFAFGLMGCQPPPPPPAHVEVLFDVTSGTHEVDVPQMADFILSHLEEELTASNRSEVEVIVSSIGETSTARTRKVTLPASESYFSRNQKEHEQKPELFKTQLIEVLTELTRPGTGKSQSSIHRNLYYRSWNLIGYSGKKLILTWSDLILNDPAVSFYDYKKHPHKLAENRDTLIAQMSKGYELPDLSGVTVINTYLPSFEEDALHEHAKAFFHHYWHERLDAEVIFQTNLPHAGGHSPTPAVAQEHDHSAAK